MFFLHCVYGSQYLGDPTTINFTSFEDYIAKCKRPEIGGDYCNKYQVDCGDSKYGAVGGICALE